MASFMLLLGEAIPDMISPVRIPQLDDVVALMS